MDFKQSHIEVSKWHALLGPLGSDRLVRTSPPASKVNGNLHFVSVDLLNEYHHYQTNPTLTYAELCDMLVLLNPELTI